MKKTVKILLLGTDFKSKNLGCSALGYSFLGILSSVAKELDLYLDIVSVNFWSINEKGENYVLRDLSIHIRRKSFRKEFKKEVNSCDVVFDFSGGDSFSDIYGAARFIQASLFKEYIQLKGKPFVMGPQTIGPFDRRWAKCWAKRILSRSLCVYARDKMSYDYAKHKLESNVKLSTDVAFLLNSNDKYNQLVESGCNIGLNVSGLLWKNGYTGNNEFGVKLDYKKFIYEFIEYLKNNNWNIWLIPHVVSLVEDSPETDYHAIDEIEKQCPYVSVAPRFESPMQAKGFISQMDFFVGSRMHATIAAFSSGVPTVSIAYSRKFKGLYDGIDYPYVLDACNTDNVEILETLKYWIVNRSKLSENIKNSIQKVQKRNSVFVDDIRKLLKDIKNG